MFHIVCFPRSCARIGSATLVFPISAWATLLLCVP